MVEELVVGKEEEEDDDEEGEEDEDEAEVVSLRGLRHSQSLPATPRSSETSYQKIGVCRSHPSHPKSRTFDPQHLCSLHHLVNVELNL